MTPSVSIIIVSYNTRDTTLACIQSIIDETKLVTYEIIVIDNKSKDGSADAIRKNFPDVTLIDAEENLGFARGNNVASKEAKSSRILLLNPDTVILNGAIDKLLTYASGTPDAKLWGGKAIFPDGTINASCWNDMTLWSTVCRAMGLIWMFPKSKFFNPETIHAWDLLENERRVDIVVGCLLLIDKDLWDQLRGFNPVFFMYGDEVDLCIRARKYGASPRITPTAKIIHYGGGSEQSSEDKLIKVFKGRVTVMLEHWSPTAARIGSFIMVTGVALRAVATLVLKPPSRKGSGQDGKINVWGGAFRRRNEWCTGWSKTPITGD